MAEPANAQPADAFMETGEIPVQADMDDPAGGGPGSGDEGGGGGDMEAGPDPKPAPKPAPAKVSGRQK
eukprot:gene67-3847_t